MIKLTINGQERTWDGDPSLPLLWFLRDEAGLTGTKYGCGKALCGACTVHVEGQAARACITAITRSRRPGARSTFRNVASVRRDKSCKQQRCCSKIRTRHTMKSETPCRATSVVADAI